MYMGMDLFKINRKENTRIRKRWIHYTIPGILFDISEMNLSRGWEKYLIWIG